MARKLQRVVKSILLENFDDTLLNEVIASNHTMHHLLPTPKSTCYSLRSIGHGLSVDFVRSELHKKTFANCMVGLFKNYC